MTRILVVLALVALLVSFATGCKSGPQASFTAEPLTGYPPLEVPVTDGSTGEAQAWEWDFDGDGIIDSTEQNPQYTYNETGNYTVSLTASNPNGNNTLTLAEYITGEPCLRYDDFTAEPTVGVGKTEVQFTDLSLGNVTAWAWDFQSDGKIDSTEQNPKFTYTRNGVYSVTLTITTTTVCEDTITRHDYISITGCST